MSYVRTRKPIVFLSLALCTLMGCLPCPCTPESTPPPEGAGASVPGPIAVATATPAPAAAGVPVLLDASGSTDTSGATLTYAWTQTGGEAVIIVNPTASQATIVAPKVRETTVFTFSVTVSNGTDSDTISVDVVVLGSNQSPVADAGTDFVTGSGSNVQLDGTKSSDPDGDTITYSWQQTGPTDSVPVAITNADTATPAFTATTGATIMTFQLTVSDGLVSSTDEVLVTVTGPGGGGGAPAPEQPTILDVIPGITPLAVATPSASNLLQAIEEMLKPPVVTATFGENPLTVLVEMLGDADREMALIQAEPLFVFKGAFNGSTLSQVIVVEGTIGDVAEGCREFFTRTNGGEINIQENPIGEGVTKIAVTRTVEPPPDAVAAASIETLATILAAITHDRYVVIVPVDNSGYQDQYGADVLRGIAQYPEAMLADVFDDSWVKGYKEGDLIVYLSGSAQLPTLPIPGFLGRAADLASAGRKIASQTTAATNQAAIMDEGPDLNAICLAVDLPEPVVLTVWLRFNNDTASGAFLAALPKSDGHMLLGLPDEPILAAGATAVTSLGSPVPPPSSAGFAGAQASNWPSQILAVVRGIADMYEFVQEVGTRQNLSISDLYDHEGRMAAAMVITTDDAEADLAVIKNRVESQCAAAKAAKSVLCDLVYVEDTGEDVGGTPVRFVDVNYWAVVDRLTSEGYLTEADVNCMFTFESMVINNALPPTQALRFRLAVADNQHIVITMEGGLSRLSDVVRNVRGNSSPLAGSDQLATAMGHVPDPRTIELYVSPVQFDVFFHEMDACVDRIDRVKSAAAMQKPQPEAIGVTFAPEGPDAADNRGISARIDAVIPWAMLYHELITINCNRPQADLNGDRSVDGADYGLFSGCFNGTGNAIAAGCECSDLNGDNSIDGADYGIFTGCFNGTGNPSPCS